MTGMPFNGHDLNRPFRAAGGETVLMALHFHRHYDPFAKLLSEKGRLIYSLISFDKATLLNVG